MTDEDLIRHAEKEVLDAAVAWATRQPTSDMSAELQRLRSAVYMLRKAHTITGKVSLEAIREAVDREEGKKKKKL